MKSRNIRVCSREVKAARKLDHSQLYPLGFCCFVVFACFVFLPSSKNQGLLLRVYSHG